MLVIVSVYVISPPGATAVTEAVCVIARSALETCTEAVAVLLARLGSVPVSLTVTELVIVEPAAAAAVMATTTVKVDDAPPANAAFAVQVIVPVPPTAGCVPQVQPAAAATDRKVVFAGVVCVIVAPAAAVVPLLVTVCVYVIVESASTKAEAGVSVTERSGVCTVTFAVLLAVAVLAPLPLTVSEMTVPFAVPAFTVTTTVNVVFLLFA